MTQSLDLNGAWKIRGFDGQHGQPEGFCGDGADERTFLDAIVPGTVHMDLERSGQIEDVNIGPNVQKARWVEEQVWVYRKRFNAPHEALGQSAWLVFDGLDLYAQVYLNGEKIGSHENSFTPLRINVTGKLKEGENLIAVRIESGLYAVSELPGMGYQPALDHQLHKRSWLRKPQCSFSWDWSPRLVNVGLCKPVRLEWTESARIDSVTVYPTLAEDHKQATLHAVVFVESVMPEQTQATLKVRIPE
ncbi:MAG: sugar-binding domain-containing protein, partial [Armatimonadota bacterium]